MNGHGCRSVWSPRQRLKKLSPGRFSFPYRESRSAAGSEWGSCVWKSRGVCESSEIAGGGVWLE